MEYTPNEYFALTERKEIESLYRPMSELKIENVKDIISKKNLAKQQKDNIKNTILAEFLNREFKSEELANSVKWVTPNTKGSKIQKIIFVIKKLEATHSIQKISTNKKISWIIQPKNVMENK